MDNRLLKQLLLDQKSNFIKKENLIERDVQESYDSLIKSKQIIVISGARRSGKSSFLKLIAEHLLENSTIKKERILYVNFDDEFFVDFKKEDFQNLLSAYFELSGNTRGKVFCFFDEIQNIPYWEKWINKLYQNKDFKIFITGSNASLLSSEIATALTGRTYTLELFPFSFREYLKYQNIEISADDIHRITTREKGAIIKTFDSYLATGGFPEIINTPLNPLDVLEGHYKDIIYKDIIVRFGIKNVSEFREVAFYLISNIGSLMSYRGLAKLIPTLGSSMTVKNYVNYLENVYLLFVVRKLESSARKQIANPFKIYGVDNGMTQGVAFSVSSNFGALYENLVYITLRRQRGLEIFYFKENFEVDFVTVEKRAVKSIIQVCYNLKDLKTQQREKRALLEALRFLNHKTGYIINDSVEKEEKIEGKIIKYIPLWKWVLSTNN